MAISIPTGAKLQPMDQASAASDGSLSLSVSWKGLYAELLSAAEAIESGDALPEPYSDWRAQAWDVRKGNAAYGVLTISATRTDSTSSSQEGGGSTEPIRDIFSLKSVRNDVSIFAYCGTSANNPSRVAVEKWMRESDSSLAKEYKYRESDGTVVDIANTPEISYSIPLIKKIEKGIESVIRFYPQLTRRRLYYAPPPDAFSNLGRVDTPPSPGGGKTLAPDGIATVISDHEWLKVQDDCDEQQDGKWMRTESWIGILKDDSSEQHAWDPDLYGDSRWKMPHDASDQS